MPSLHRTLSDLDLRGKRVLCRVDFNVPFDGEGRITDDTRIRAAIPTLEAILVAGGKPVLMSHLGRPKGEVVESLRLDAVGVRLGELLGRPVRKLDESCGEGVLRSIEDTPGGQVVLLENIRFHPGETKGDENLSVSLAQLGDVFVNDAFGASHRAHCSVSGVAAHLPSAPGLLLEREIRAFDRVLGEPDRPFVAILGGAKVSDKLLVIENLLERVDAILIGGAMAYTFAKGDGHGIGTSMCEEDLLETVRSLRVKAQERKVDLLTPLDHVCAREFRADAEVQVTDGVEIPEGWMGLDIGPRTRERYAAVIAGARTVVWNGPMGVFEMEAFRPGTEGVAKAVAECPGFTVVGGGDSVAAIGLLGLGDRIGHISTGGGASLELLGGKALPGVVAVR